MTPYEAIDWLRRNTDVMRTDDGAFVIAVLLNVHCPRVRAAMRAADELVSDQRADFPKLLGGWF